MRSAACLLVHNCLPSAGKAACLQTSACKQHAMNQVKQTNRSAVVFPGVWPVGWQCYTCCMCLSLVKLHLCTVLFTHGTCPLAYRTKSHCLQVTTEGDAFIVAFHDPLDAIGWALHVQLAMLEAPWPPELLQHPQAKVETCPEGKLLFRGLRVRMAINTGVPAEIIVCLHAYMSECKSAAAPRCSHSQLMIFCCATYAEKRPCQDVVSALHDSSAWGFML